MRPNSSPYLSRTSGFNPRTARVRLVVLGSLDYLDVSTTRTVRVVNEYVTVDCGFNPRTRTVRQNQNPEPGEPSSTHAPARGATQRLPILH